MQFATPLFFTILVCSIQALCANAINIEVAQTKNCVEYLPIQDAMLRSFCSPIRFTQDGIAYYLQEIYNNPSYSKEFLPHNLTHVQQLLEYGLKNNAEPSYGYASLQLLNNKIKASPYIASTALNSLLYHLPSVLKHYCKKHNDHTFLKSIKETLYSMFLNDYQKFEENPDEFFETVSTQIHIVSGTIVNHHVEQEQLRSMIIRFLENSIGKVIWCPNDQEGVWRSVKESAESLQLLVEYEIITLDDLNDLYISLIESFCRFLEIAGSDLTLETLTAIQNDILSQEIILLQLEEQEEGIETKAARLEFALHLTQAKVRARMQHGTISERIIY